MNPEGYIGLAPQHAALVAASCIDPDTAAARGYRTAVRADLTRLTPHAFGRPKATALCAASGVLLIPLRWGRPDAAAVGHQVRPDVPATPATGKARKYETPGGQPNRLDCHPHAWASLRDPKVVLVVTEGTRKADAAWARLRLPAIALTGVSNWRGRNAFGGVTALGQWEDVPLKGRTVLIAFDSDVRRKVGVHTAMVRLARYLADKGARILFVILTDAEDGAKVGLDDWLHAHPEAELADVMALAASEPPSLGVQGDDRPSVMLGLRPLHEVHAEAVAALWKANDPPRLFAYGTAAAQVRLDGSPTNDLIHALARETLAVEVGTLVNFLRPAEGGELREATPPDDLMATLGAVHPSPTDGRLPFPPLVGVSMVPVLHDDGSIRTEAGYDPESGLYLAEGLELVEPDDPVATFVAPFAEFPFREDQDRARCYAFALGYFVGQLLRTNLLPLFVIVAPAARTGKSLIARVVSWAVTGADMAAEQWPEHEEERRKSLLAVALGGRPLVGFDNLQSVSSNALEAALTTELVGGRLLGQSREVRCPRPPLIVVTGNNLQLRGDLPPRSLPIRIDAAMEHPEDRTGFALELPRWMAENRTEWVAAALMLIRSWMEAGRLLPEIGTEDSWAPWGRAVAGVLEVNGLGEFHSDLTKRREEVGDDTDDWVPFLHALHARFGSETFTSATVWKGLTDLSAGEPLEALIPGSLVAVHKVLESTTRSRHAFARNLTWAFNRQEGAIHGGLRVMRTGTVERAGTAYFRVERLDDWPW